MTELKCRIVVAPWFKRLLRLATAAAKYRLLPPGVVILALTPLIGYAYRIETD